MSETPDRTGDARYRQYGGVMALLIAAAAVAFPLYHVLYLSGLLAKARIFPAPMILNISGRKIKVGRVKTNASISISMII